MVSGPWTQVLEKDGNANDPGGVSIEEAGIVEYEEAHDAFRHSPG